jgi:hypothetical protein
MQTLIVLAGAMLTIGYVLETFMPGRENAIMRVLIGGGALLLVFS